MGKAILAVIGLLICFYLCVSFLAFAFAFQSGKEERPAYRMSDCTKRNYDYLVPAHWAGCRLGKWSVKERD